MKIALFLTPGTSIALWNERGWLGGSAVKSYNAWADACEGVVFVSGGGEQDLTFRHALRKNILVLINRWRIGPLLYSVLSPWLHFRTLKDVDLFFTAQMHGAWTPLIAKILFRKKFVLRCGYPWTLGGFGREIGPIKRILAIVIEWVCFTAADYVIVTSDAARQYAIHRYKKNPNKITVMRNPVDTDLFRPMGLPKKARSLVFVGRLEPQKNLFALFEAMQGLDASLTIFGQGSLESALRNFAKIHHLQVSFRGIVSNHELPKELNQHEIFILPSLFEGSPKALLEAMSCGLPVIATDVLGNQEVIRNHETGVVCQTDAKSLRQALTDVLGKNDFQRKIGLGAREYVLRHCHLRRKIEKEITIFRSLIQKSA